MNPYYQHYPPGYGPPGPFVQQPPGPSYHPRPYGAPPPGPGGPWQGRPPPGYYPPPPQPAPAALRREPPPAPWAPDPHTVHGHQFQRQRSLPAPPMPVTHPPSQPQPQPHPQPQPQPQPQPPPQPQPHASDGPHRDVVAANHPHAGALTTLATSTLGSGGKAISGLLRGRSPSGKPPQPQGSKAKEGPHHQGPLGSRESPPVPQHISSPRSPERKIKNNHGNLIRVPGKLMGVELCTITCNSAEQAGRAVVLNTPGCVGFTFRSPFPARVHYIKNGMVVDGERSSYVSYVKQYDKAEPMEAASPPEAGGGRTSPSPTPPAAHHHHEGNRQRIKAFFRAHLREMRSGDEKEREKDRDRALAAPVPRVPSPVPAAAPSPAHSPAGVVRPEKGLQNEAGANNCFLNVVLQAFWHLDAFRERFRGVSKHHCRGSTNCVLCAIQSLFVEYLWTSHSSIPPDSVRQVVSRVFADVDRFQLGDMADAAELLDCVLLVLHDAIVPHGEEDCDPPCFVHASFGSCVVESTDVCECGSEGESQSHVANLHYFPANLLHPDPSAPAALEDRVHAHFVNEFRTCGMCGERSLAVTKSLQKAPDICTFVLAWSSHSVEKAWLETALAQFQQSIDLVKVYPIVDGPKSLTYNLKGIICFYGMHYVCFFHSSSLNQWLYFDDANFRPAGTFDQIITQMVTGRLLPLVVFFTPP